MSPSHVLEPTYERLKRELMRGRWPQDTRLEAMRIAEDYGVSATPVRDCLNRLTGEGLVSLRPGEGYRVPRLTEMSVRDMLELHDLLLTSSLTGEFTHSDRNGDAEYGKGYAAAVTTIFVRIAEASGNSAIAFTVRALGERLFPIRKIEPDFLDGTGDELEQLREAFRRRPEKLAARVAAYHARRTGRIAELVAALP